MLAGVLLLGSALTAQVSPPLAAGPWCGNVSATGATVVVVSSDVEALRRFAPRLGMLHGGRLRYDGPADVAVDATDPAVRQFVRGDLDGPL